MNETRKNQRKERDARAEKIRAWTIANKGKFPTIRECCVLFGLAETSTVAARGVLATMAKDGTIERRGNSYTFPSTRTRKLELVNAALQQPIAKQKQLILEELRQLIADDVE